MEVPTVGQILLQYSRKDTFVFTRNVNNHKMDRKTVHQTVRFTSQFSMEIHIKFSKQFR